MKYGVAFLLLGCACGVYAWMATAPPIRLLLANGALCFSGVGAAFLGAGPRAFMKRTDGRLPLHSQLLFWPYLLLNHLGLLLVRRAGRERAVDEVAPGLYLGQHLAGTNTAALDIPGFTAVLDLTAEFGETAALRSVPHYRCIPLLDTFAPTAEQLAEGVAFIAEHQAEGSVYMHCALGHGRSALFVAAYLVSAGRAGSAEAAEEQVRAARPGVALNPAQQRALRGFAATVGRGKVGTSG